MHNNNYSNAIWQGWTWFFRILFLLILIFLFSVKLYKVNFKYNMRIKRTIIIISLLLIIWSSVLYFLLSYHPIFNERNHGVDRQMAILEKGILEQFDKNSFMINNAQIILELKKAEEQRGELLTESKDSNLPVLVFACNRITVSRCLDKLILYRPDPHKFPIIVSQVSLRILLCIVGNKAHIIWIWGSLNNRE